MTLEELHCFFVSFAPPDVQVLCDGSTMDHFGVLVQREWVACIADAIRERNALRQRIESAPVGEIVCGRANSFGGYHVEIAHDVSWVKGKRVRLVVEDGE